MARNTDIQPLLASLDLFAGCTRSELRLVTELATVCEVGPEVVLCAEGEPGQTFYAIARGEVRVSVDAEEVATLGAGCGFGEIALLHQGGRRVATVTTTGPTRLVLFSRPEFATLMAEIPVIARSLLSESRRRLQARESGPEPFATS